MALQHRRQQVSVVDIRYIELDFSTPHVLRSVKEYNAAVAEVDKLVALKAKKGTREDDRLAFLTVLIEAYENEPVPEPRDVTPQEAVNFFLAQHGASRTELAKLTGAEVACHLARTGPRAGDRCGPPATRKPPNDKCDITRRPIARAVRNVAA